MEERRDEESCKSPPPTSDTLSPWNWNDDNNKNTNLSPESLCSSPETRNNRRMDIDCINNRSGGSESHRRGRPRADALTNLMQQGTTSPSSIKCTFCHRVFPREKSLQAHLRTHTGNYIYAFIIIIIPNFRLLIIFFNFCTWVFK